MKKQDLGEERNAPVSGQASGKSTQLQGGEVKEGWFDMDVFDENTAPYHVGGSQGETSSVEAGRKMIRKNQQSSSQTKP